MTLLLPKQKAGNSSAYNPEVLQKQTVTWAVGSCSADPKLQAPLHPTCCYKKYAIVNRSFLLAGCHFHNIIPDKPVRLL